MAEITDIDRKFRRDLLKLIIDAIDRPCSEGDMIEDRQDAMDLMIADFREKIIESCACLPSCGNMHA